MANKSESKKLIGNLTKVKAEALIIFVSSFIVLFTWLSTNSLNDQNQCYIELNELYTNRAYFGYKTTYTLEDRTVDYLDRNYAAIRRQYDDAIHPDEASLLEQKGKVKNNEIGNYTYNIYETDKNINATRVKCLSYNSKINSLNKWTFILTIINIIISSIFLIRTKWNNNNETSGTTSRGKKS